MIDSGTSGGIQMADSANGTSAGGTQVAHRKTSGELDSAASGGISSINPHGTLHNRQ